MKINEKNITVKTVKRQAEIWGLLHPAEASLGYSLQLLSTKCESPLASKSHVSFVMYSTVNRIFHISILLGEINTFSTGMK
jgi:hypothetical protein